MFNVISKHMTGIQGQTFSLMWYVFVVCYIVYVNFMQYDVSMYVNSNLPRLPFFEHRYKKCTL